MSLQYLGISHFPVLHRQFSSASIPLSDASPSQDPTQEDSKDVLIQRLNDLVLRLSTSQEVEDGTITTAHSQVDKIERLLEGEDRPPKPSHSRSGSDLLKSKEEFDPFWGPATPTHSMKMHLPDMSRSSPRPVLRRSLQMSPAKAIELAQSAEDLASRLVFTVEELQRRKEESDHIHDLLLTRVERAAERILVLEDRIAEM